MQTSHDAHEQTNTTTLRLRDLCGVCCADAAERALRARPHVLDVKVDYRAETATVTYHAGMTTPDELAASVRVSGCLCEPDSPDHGRGPIERGEEARASATGADVDQTAHLAHRAQMAPITQGTKQDRMQYEFAATRLGADHPGHAAPAAPTAQ